VHDDVASADRLVEAVVIDHIFFSGGFPPDLDSEGIGGAIVGPELELVGAAIGVESPVDGCAGYFTYPPFLSRYKYPNLIKIFPFSPVGIVHMVKFIEIYTSTQIADTSY